MKSIRKKEKELRESIHELMDEDKLNKKKVSRLMDEYFQFESEKFDLRRKHHKEIDEVLTAKQTIKYLLLTIILRSESKSILKIERVVGTEKDSNFLLPI